MTVLRSGRAVWHRWVNQTLDDRDLRRDKREALTLLVVIAFVFINAAAYSLSREGSLQWSHLYAPLIWATVVVLAHLTLRPLRPRRDPFLLPVFALLTGWGLLLQDRLAPNFLGRQTLWFSLSTLALLAVAVLPGTLQPLRRYRYVVLLGGIVLLAITLAFGVNPSGSGAALWLPVPFPFLGLIYFQPSELLKLVLVVFLASYFTEQEPLHHYRRRAARAERKAGGEARGALRRHLPFLGPLLLMWGFTLLLLVWQQDLGAAALFFIVFVGLVYLATGERLYVGSGLILLLLAGVIAFFAFDTVVAGRVLSWIDPWPNVSDRAYQIVQALYAQAAGGIFGQGIGQGFPDYIPVVHSDFALAAIAEEWGLLGSLTVVVCYALLAARGLRVALLAIRGPRPNFFHAYLSAGLVTLISVQAFLIMGGITRLLPLTGITLPFVSYGGSSLLISSVAVGLLLWLSAAAEPAPLLPPADRHLARRVVRLGTAFLMVFFIIALALTYWSVLRAGAMAVREDNPRLVEAERRVRRGRILAQNGTVLAESTGPADNLTRHYPRIGGPAVGYYSLRFGAAGIEGALDGHLRGRSEAFWPAAIQRLSHVPPTGGDVRLTLDAELQEAASTMMVDSGVAGGLVLLEMTTIDGAPVADLRAMASLPGYDPNQIDREFETLAAADPGPLVNRASQGLYQPGLIVQPFITAAAVDAATLSLDDRLADPHQPVTLNGQVLRCVTPRSESGLAYAWANMAALRCPAPLRALGEQLGPAALDDIFTRFGLHRAPDLVIPSEGSVATITDAGLAAIGQEALTVTPLQAALATAILAGDGQAPAPRLVEALAPAGDQWETQPPGAAAVAMPVINPSVAAEVRAGWPTTDEIAGFAVTALSGPQNQRTTWFLGFAPAQNPRFVVALALEDVDDVVAAEAIGRALLGQAIDP